ncbi:MAG: MIP/aquaporin family protein [Candidatus Rhabdochlamydia sp.]
MAFFWAEFLGTALFVMLGNGVIANNLLAKTKGQNGGWITIAAGWGLALMLGIYAAGWVSGAHLNPAVTLALWFLNKIDVHAMPFYLGGQMAGAFTGSLIVWLAYFPHFQKTSDAHAKLACFATEPAIRSYGWNFVSEMIGTMVFIIGILCLGNEHTRISASIAPCITGLLFLGIGLSLGGPTGYALNPARDLAPRLAYTILPIKGKGSSDWSYALIPVIAPLAGALLGAFIYHSYLGLLIPSLT